MPSKARIKTFIVDDELPGRSRIRQFLRLESDFEISGEFGNGRQALEAIIRDKPDLVFLDVQMPGLSGIEVCHALTSVGAKLPMIIFVTAYDKYAVKAFELHAVDYLLKPFDSERFQKSLARARAQISSAVMDQAGIREMLKDLLPVRGKPRRIVIKEDGRMVFLNASTIDWMEADGNYVRIHVGTSSHYVRETLSSLESQLPADSFIRISRSVVVNLERIKEMQPMFYGDYVVVLQDGSKLTLSRNFKARFEAAISRERAGD